MNTSYFPTTSQRFATVRELAKALGGGAALLDDVYRNREKWRYNSSDAASIHGEGMVQNLVNKGLLYDNGERLSLDPDTQQYVERKMGEAPIVSDSFIRDCLNELKVNIERWDKEEITDNGRRSILTNIKRILDRMVPSLFSLICDMRRAIDSVYKTERDFVLKRECLNELISKREEADSLVFAIKNTFFLEYDAFFQKNGDTELKRKIAALPQIFRHIELNLSSLNDKIIEYFHKIEADSLFITKLQRLKALKDKNDGSFEKCTNISTLGIPPLLATKTPVTTTLVPLPLLRDSDEGGEVLRRYLQKREKKREARTSLAPTLTSDDIRQEVKMLPAINEEGVKDAFLASDDNLFHFVLCYDYGMAVSEDERIDLYVAIATQYHRELLFLPTTHTAHGFRYTIILPKRKADEQNAILPNI